MTTPAAPNSISFSQIAAEFGYPPNKNLGAYRVDQLIGDRTWPLDDNVPRSGTIKFSDLRGKTLNVIVDYSGGETTTAGTAKDNYLGVPSTVASNVTPFLRVVNSDHTDEEVYISSRGSGTARVRLTVDVDDDPNIAGKSFNRITINSNGSQIVHNYRTEDYTQNFDIDITGGQSYRIDFIGLDKTIGRDPGRVGDNIDINSVIPTNTVVELNGIGLRDDGGDDCNARFFINQVLQQYDTVVNTNGGVVVGGFKPFPTASETKKARHLIRRKIGNGLPSGDWDANTVLLQFIITGSGSIYGYGGYGGHGMNIDNKNSAGLDGYAGGNALSVTYNSTVVVESNGILAGGGGGGGGGGYQYNPGPDARGAGYGGGGGAGFPAGGGGAAGYVDDGGRNNNVCQGGPGCDGTLTTGGIGGPQSGCVRVNPCSLTGGGNGGTGGTGGNLGSGGGNGENRGRGAGTGGSAGAAISHPGVTVTLVNNGSVYGNT